MDSVSLYTITTGAQGDIQNFPYYLDTPSGDLVNQVFNNLNIQNSQNNIVYYRNLQGSSVLIEKNVTLRSLNAQNGDYLQVLFSESPVNVEYVYSTPQNYEYSNISMPVMSSSTNMQINNQITTTNQQTPTQQVNNTDYNQNNQYNYNQPQIQIPLSTSLNNPQQNQYNIPVNGQNEPLTFKPVELLQFQSGYDHSAQNQVDNPTAMNIPNPNQGSLFNFSPDVNQNLSNNGNTNLQPQPLGLFGQQAPGQSLFTIPEADPNAQGIFSNQVLGGLFGSGNIDNLGMNFGGDPNMNNFGSNNLNIFEVNGAQNNMGQTDSNNSAYQFGYTIGPQAFDKQVLQSGLSWNTNSGNMNTEDLDGGNIQLGSKDYDPTLFNSSIALKANNQYQVVQDGPGTSDFMMNAGIVIDTDIEETNNTEFGALKKSGEELAEMWKKQGMQSYKIRVILSWDDKRTTELTFFQMYEYADVRGLVVNHFQLDNDLRYSFHFSAEESDSYWLKEGSSLERYKFPDGSILTVYMRDLKVRVMTYHFPPRMVNIDAELPVANVIEDLTKKLEIVNPYGYSLYSQEGEIELPLNQKKSVPEQTKNYSQLNLRREFFLLSRIDIYSLETAIQTYEDSKRRVFADNLYILDAMALEFAALQFFIEGEPAALENPTFPDNIHFLFPECCDYSHTLGPKLLNYVKNYPKIDKFNAIRRWLGMIRRYPGFGVISYECKVRVANAKGVITLDVAVEVSPLALTLFDLKTNALEDKISYTKILKVECVEDTLSIAFYIGRSSVAKYEFICSLASEMEEIINQQKMIIKKLMVQRAQKTELLPPEISDKFKVKLPTSKTLTITEDLPEFDYDINYTGQLLNNIAEKNIGLIHDDNHIPFVCLGPDIYRFIYKDDVLAMIGVSDGMNVYIINRIEDIEVTFPDERVKTVKLDITKTVEDLTADCFKAIEFPALSGYSLWYENDQKEVIPLDLRFNIPEQIPYYKKIILKRRFYILSGEILVTPEVATMTMIETMKVIKDLKCPVSESQLLEFCVLYTYAHECQNMSDIENITNFDYLKCIVPDKIPIDQSFVQKIKRTIATYPPKDKIHALKKFIGNIRVLDNFGYEIYPCQYKEVTPGRKSKVHKDFVFILAPLYFVIAPAKTGMSAAFQIGYRFIIKYQCLNNYLIMTFVSDDHGNVAIVKIMFKEDMATIMMLLEYNIKLLNDLINNRELMRRKAIEEEIKRLNGGLIDEWGILHGPMRDFFVSKDPLYLSDLPKAWVDLKYTGQQLSRVFLQQLKLPKENTYCVLYRSPDKEYSWIAQDKQLKDYRPQRCSTLIVLEKNPVIKVIPIGSKDSRLQTVKIDVTMTVGEIINGFAEMFGIPIFPGITFAIDKNNKLTYLDINRSIPEQCKLDETFLILLRHFSFTLDNLAFEALWFLFLQIRETILRGVYKIEDDAVIKLCFFQIPALSGNPATLELVPKKDSEWVPRGMTKPQITNHFNHYTQDYGKLDAIGGVKHYIEFARSLPNFSMITFNVKCDLGYDAKSKPKHQLNIAIDKIIINSAETGQQYLKINLSDILEFHARLNEVEIRFRDEEFNPQVYYAFTKEANNIYYIIQEIISIARTNLCILSDNMRQENKIESKEYMVSIGVNALLSGISESKKMEFSSLQSGGEVLQKIVNSLNLEPSIIYIMIIVCANGVYKFVDLTLPFGIMYPTEKSEIYIYPQIARIPISMETGQKELIPIDLTAPIHEAIQRIASYFYIHFFSGYVIYKDWDIEAKALDIKPLHTGLQPLDLTKSLVEQTLFLDFLFFKRRFFTFTIEDVRHIDRRSFLEVRKYILNRNEKTNDAKAIELAVYSILADSPSFEQAQQVRIDNVEKILPKTTKIESDTASKIKDVLMSSPKMTSEEAMRKYVSTARNLAKFGCECFDAVYIKSVGAQNDNFANACIIAIGPFGLQAIEKDTEIVFMRVSYLHIVSYSQISSTIVIKAVIEDGQIGNLEFNSPDAAKIGKIIDEHQIGVRPRYNERLKVQKLMKEQAYAPLLESVAKSSLNMKISPFVNDPASIEYKFNPDWYEPDAVKYCLLMCAIPQEIPYHIIYRDENNMFRWLEKNRHLQTINPDEGKNIFLVPYTFDAFVSPKDGNISIVTLKARVPIRENVRTVCDYLGLGPGFGCTFYSLDPNRGTIPLDFLHPLPTETQYYIDLVVKRRFFIILTNFMSDPNYYIPVFHELIKEVKTGKHELSINCIIELGICQLYGNCYSEEETEKLQFSVSDAVVKTTLPNSVVLTPELAMQFKKEFVTHKKMTQFEAIHKYLAIVGMIYNFSPEIYEAVYKSDNADTIQYNNTKITVKVSASCITLISKSDSYVFLVIKYSDIIAYSMINHSCNIQFHDKDGILEDIYLESKDYRSIMSFINDILDCQKFIVEGHNELLRDETIDVEKLGLKSENFVFGAHDNHGDEGDYEIGLIDLDNIAAVEINIGDDSRFVIDDDILNDDASLEEWKNLKVQNFANSEMIEDDLQDEDITWRADPKALSYSRGKSAFEKVSYDLSNIMDNLENNTVYELADKFERIRNSLKDVDFGLDDDNKGLKNLRNHIENLFTTIQTAATSAVDIHEISGHLIRDIKAAINTTTKQIDKADIKIIEIKKNAQEQKAQLVQNDYTQTVASNMVFVSQCEEKMANIVLSHADQINQMGYNAQDLVDTLRANSSAIIQIAAQIKAIEDPAQITKYLPEISSVHQQADFVHQFNKYNASFNVRIEGMEELEKELQKALSNTEKLVANAKSVNKQPELVAKTKAHQVYLGNHSKVEEVADKLADILSKNQSILANENLKNNVELLKLLQVISSKLEDSLNGLKKQTSALNKNPMNDAARSASVDTLYQLKEDLKQFMQVHSQALSAVPDSKNLIDSSQQLYPVIDEALCNISTANITPDSVSNVVKSSTDFAVSALQTAQANIAKFNANQVNFIQQQHQAILAKINSMKNIQQNLEADPTSGLLVKEAQKQLLDFQKALPQIYEYSNMVNSVSGNQNLAANATKLLNEINATVADVQSTETNVICPHLAKYQQALVEISRELNQLSICKENLAVQNSEFNQIVSEVRERLIALRETQNNCRKDLKKRPFHQPYIKNATDALDEAKIQVDRIVEIASRLQNIAPESKIGPLTTICAAAIDAAIESFNASGINDFRKPPSKEQVGEIIQDVVKEIQVFSELIKTPEIQSKPKVSEELQKRIQLYNQVGKELEVQFQDPTAEFIPLAEQLKQMNQDIKNLLLGVQAYKQNSSFTTIVEKALSNLDYSLIKTPPNIDLAIKSIDENINPMQSLQSILESLKAKDMVKTDMTALRIINDWSNTLNQGFFEYGQLKQKQKPVESDVIKVKDALLKINNALAQIPTELKPYLNNADYTAFGKTIAAVRNHSSIAVSCVRLLPTIEKFEFDSSPFKDVSTANEVSEIIQEVNKQFNSLTQIISKAQQRKDIIDNIEANNTCELLKKLLSEPNLAQAQVSTDDKLLINTFIKAKEIMPECLENASKITGYLNNESFVQVMKTISDNVTKCHMMLTRPHLTTVSAPKIVESIVRNVESVLPAIANLFNLNEVKANNELLRLIQTYQQNATAIARQMPTQNTQAQQQLLDQLNNLTANLLQTLDNVPGALECVDKLEPVYSITNKYTTQQRIPIKVAGHLIPRKPKELDDQTVAAFNLAANHIMAQAIKPDEVAPYLNFLARLQQLQQGVPLSIVNNARAFIPCIKTGKPIYASDAARIIAISSNVPEMREKMLQILALRDCLKASSYSVLFSRALSEIDKIVSAYMSLIPQAAVGIYSHLQSDVDAIDPKILTSIPTFENAISQYQALHNFYDSITTFVNMLSNIPQLKDSTKGLVQVLSEFSPWLKQSDLVMEALVFTCADSITKNLEDIMQKDELGKIPDSAQTILDQMVPILKNNQRGIAFNNENAELLSNLLTNFNDSCLDIVNKNAPHSQEKDAVNNSFNFLSKLKPVMRIWSTNKETNSPEIIRNEAESSLASILRDLEASLSSSKLKAEQSIALSSADAALASLGKKLSALNTNKAAQVTLQVVSKMKLEVNKQMNSNQLVNLNDFKNMANVAINNSKQIATVSVPKLTVKRVAPANKPIKLDLSMFKEQSSALTAQSISKLAMALQASADSSVASIATTSGINNTPIKPVVVNAKEIFALQKERLAQPLSTVTKINFLIDSKPIESRIADIQEVDIKSPPTALNDIFKNIIRQNQNFILAQRLTDMQNQQRTVFPDIQSIDNPDDIHLSDVQSNISLLLNQLNTINNLESLRSTQAELNPNQVILQQSLLTDAAKSVLSSEMQLPGSNLSATMKKLTMQMFENFVVQSTNSNTPPLSNPSNVQNYFCRCVTMMNLLAKLQTLNTEILRQNPDIFRFAKTSEGFKALNQNLAAHEITEAQNMITNHIKSLNTPESLSISLKSTSPKSLIHEIRITTNLLEMLADSAGNKIVVDDKISPREISVLSSALLNQFEALKNDQNKANLSALVEIPKSQKIESYQTYSMCKLDLTQKLISIHQQLSTSPSASVQVLQLSKDPKQDIVMIAKQVELIDDQDQYSQYLATLSPENIQSQINIINLLLNYVSTTDTTSIDKEFKANNSNIGQIFSKLASQIVEKELDSMFANPDKIQSIDIRQASILQPMQMIDYLNVSASKAMQISNAIQNVRQKLQRPMSPQELQTILNSNPQYSDIISKKIDYVNGVIEFHPESLNNALAELAPVDQSFLLSSLIHSLDSIVSFSNTDAVVKNMVMEDKIFDHASLLQRDPKNVKTSLQLVGIPANIEKSSNVFTQMSTIDVLANLQRKRVAAIPGIIEASVPQLIERVSEQLTPEKLDQLRVDIFNQLNTTNTEKLQAELQATNPDDLVLQQLLIGSSIDSLYNDSVVNSLIEANNQLNSKALNAVSTTDIINEILSQKVDTFAKIPHALTELQLKSDAELATISQDAIEQKERARLSYKLFSTIQNLSLKLPNNNSVKNVNITKQEIPELQQKVRQMIENPIDDANLTDAQSLEKLSCIMQSLADTIKPVTLNERQLATEASKLGMNKIAVSSVAKNPKLIKKLTPKSSVASQFEETKKSKGGKNVTIKKSTVKGKKALDAIVSAAGSDAKSVVVKKGNKKSVIIKKPGKKNSVAVTKDEYEEVPDFVFTERDIRPISIFDQPINLEAITAAQKSTKIVTPEISQVMKDLVETANNTVQTVSSMANAPIEQAQSTMKNTSEAISEACKKLLESNELVYNPEVEVLVQTLPDFVGSMTRIYPTINKNARTLLPPDPSICIAHTSTIYKNSVNLKDPTNFALYRNSLSELLQIALSVSSSLSNEKKDPISIASNLISAIKSNDIPKTNIEIANFKAAKVQAYSNNSSEKLLKQFKHIEDGLAKIAPAVKQICFKPTDPATKSAVSIIASSVPSVVSIISSEAKVPFSVVNEVKTVSQISPIVNDNLSQINSSITSLVQAISTPEKPKASENLVEIVKTTADTQNLLLRGFNLNNSNLSFPAMVDFVGRMDRTINHLNTIVTSTKSSATPISLMRSQRRLARVVERMKDAIVNPESSPPAKTKFEQKRNEFMKGISSAMQSMLSTLSLRATTKVDESYVAVMKSQLPSIKNSVKAVQDVASQLINMNKNISADANFSKNITNLCSKFENLLSTSNKSNNISELMAALSDLSSIMVETVSSLGDMTEKESDVPDLSSSEKLPIQFSIPTTQQETTDINTSDVCSEIMLLNSRFVADFTDFTNKSLSAKTSNTELCDKVNAMNKQLKQIFSRMQSLQGVMINFERKSEIEKSMNEISSIFNGVINNTRMKFLLSCPNYESTTKENQTIVDSIFSKLNKSLSAIAKDSEKDEKMKQNFGIKFSQTMTPLNEALDLLISSQNTVNALPKGPTKERALQALEVSKKLGESIKSIFVYMQENPSSDLNIDLLSDFANKVTIQLKNVDAHIHDMFAKKGTNDEHIFAAMSPFADLLETYNNTISSENTSMLDTAVSVCCAAAEKLASTTNASPEPEKIISHKLDIQSLSDEDLMKKLILEAKVIKAKLLLSRYERILDSV